MVALNKFGFYEVVDKPSQQELIDYYAKKYYQDGEISTYRHEYSKEELAYFNNKINQKHEYLISKGVLERDKTYSIIDVGCGEGFTINYFKQLGWEITGLDFSDYGCKNFHPECVENLIVGDIYQNIEQLALENKRYDVIWLDNVLEHVLNPLDLLKILYKISSETGVLIIEVPNDFSVVQEYLLKNNILEKPNWIIVPDHISYFNKNGLSNLCAAAEWSMLDIISDFPIDWFLFNQHSNYYLDKSKGKAAHQARITLENMLHNISSKDVIQFYKSLADLGMGRQLIGFFKKM